ALVDRGSTGGRDGLGDLGGRDGAEEATGRAGANLDDDLLRLERVTHSLGLVEACDLARLAGRPDRGHLLLSALGPRRGQAAGQEEVTGVPVLHVDHVAGLTETGHL